MSTFEDFLTGEYGWLAMLVIVMVFTGLTIIYYVKKDKYDPEPPSRLIYGFILGIFSVIPAILLSLLGGIFVSFNPALMSIIIAPVTEEIAKLWCVIYLAKHRAFDGPLDGLIYGAMVGAGFAAAENLLYGLNATIGDGIASGLTLTAIRSVTQIVGHPLYTGLAGVGVGEWKVGLEQSKYNKIWRSMLFHGLWNLSANMPTFELLIGGLIAVVIINVIFLRRELHRTLQLDKDAYDRGYYDQKAKKEELRTQQQNAQVRQWQSTSQTQSGVSLDQGREHPSISSRLGPRSPVSFQTAGPRASPQSKERVSPNFCKKCGTKTKQGDIFCRYCGHKMI